MAQARQHYDERATRHEEIAEDEETQVVRRVNNFAKQALIATALDLLAAEDDGAGVAVLDLCCGRGQDLHKLARKTAERGLRIARYTGMDVSAASIEEARARLGTAAVPADRCRFVVRDLDGPPGAGDPLLPAFDLALLHFCLNYFARPAALFRALYAAGAPGAVVSVVYADGCVVEARRCGALPEDAARFRVEFGDAEAGAEAGAAYRFHLGRSVAGAAERLLLPGEAERAARGAGFSVLAHAPLTHFVAAQLEFAGADRRADWAHMMRGLRLEPRDWRTTGCYRALLLSKAPRGAEPWFLSFRERLDASV